jgi:hypothetical protein
MILAMSEKYIHRSIEETTLEKNSRRDPTSALSSPGLAHTIMEPERYKAHERIEEID